MVYRGHVKNGVIVLDEAVRLPDGAEVAVEVPGQEPPEEMHPDIARFTGILPADLDARETYSRAIVNKHR